MITITEKKAEEKIKTLSKSKWKNVITTWWNIKKKTVVIILAAAVAATTTTNTRFNVNYTIKRKKKHK